MSAHVVQVDTFSQSRPAPREPWRYSDGVRRQSFDTAEEARLEFDRLRDYYHREHLKDTAFGAFTEDAPHRLVYTSEQETAEGGWIILICSITLLSEQEDGA